uniref:Uncharacterized protein n=1 Tax=Ixodes ricinus TaxID=34613 RepID=A0A6B0U6C7_IXORI
MLKSTPKTTSIAPILIFATSTPRSCTSLTRCPRSRRTKIPTTGCPWNCTKIDASTTQTSTSPTAPSTWPPTSTARPPRC